MLRGILSRLGGRGTTRRPTAGAGGIGRTRTRGGATGSGDVERGVRSLVRGASRRRGTR